MAKAIKDTVKRLLGDKTASEYVKEHPEMKAAAAAIVQQAALESAPPSGASSDPNKKVRI